MAIATALGTVTSCDRGTTKDLGRNVGSSQSGSARPGFTSTAATPSRTGRDKCNVVAELQLVENRVQFSSPKSLLDLSSRLRGGSNYVNDATGPAYDRELAAAMLDGARYYADYADYAANPYRPGPPPRGGLQTSWVATATRICG